MKLFVRDKDFYKKVATVAIPISLQSMITIGVNMMDTIMLRLCIGMAVLLFMLPTIFIPDILMRLYTPDQAVIEQGILYYRYMVPCYLLQGMALTCTIVLRSVGVMRIPLYSSIGAFFVNIFFNYTFIFSKFGAPRMKIRGAALGTLIARVFEFTFICGYFFLLDKKVKYRVKDLFMKCSSLVHDYIVVSIPVLVSDSLLALWQVSTGTWMPFGFISF